jgi:hypothetical protein
MNVNVEIVMAIARWELMGGPSVRWALLPQIKGLSRQEIVDLFRDVDEYLNSLVAAVEELKIMVIHY